MELEHLQPFLNAMHQRNTGRLGAHLADDVFLRSPIVVKQFEGKDQVLAVLKALLTIIDRFEVTDTLIGDDHVAVVLKIKMGDIEVDGVDYIEIDQNGLIKSMIIQWRPLPSVVAIQQKLAPVIGIPALKLIEPEITSITGIHQQTSGGLPAPARKSGGWRILAIVVRVFCVLPFALGAADMVGSARILTSGGAILSENVTQDAVLNNQIRFWGAIWFGYGLLLWWTSNDLRDRAPVFRILMATLFLSGLGRAASVVQFGWASTSLTGAMAIELLSPPALIAWAQRLHKNTAR